jgi:hypothetical protein
VEPRQSRFTVRFGEMSCHPAHDIVWKFHGVRPRRIIAKWEFPSCTRNSRLEQVTSSSHPLSFLVRKTTPAIAPVESYVLQA